jgi:glycosyltransferase involved in cell wall biosynthesis
LLLGQHSEFFARALLEKNPSLSARVISLGRLPAPEVARALSACDLVLQPYPDGISARRTSAMASLALGLPVVTNQGSFSEPLWASSGAVALASSAQGDLLARVAEGLLQDEPLRAELGRRGKALYQSRFSLERTVQTLTALAAEEDATL